MVKGYISSELAYGSHKSAAMYGFEVLAKAAVDAALGKAVILQETPVKDTVSLRVSSFDVVGEKEKLRVFSDLTFSRGLSGRTEERGDKRAKSNSANRR